ncbi:luciferin 4-monooxygenase-like isoform X1 [Aricia agestis]|uniref:luciferin 4-monooxygenase-like isoform X1 n=1 Tax=Aricia agestis TaxID=91739 RepID=UPI001C206AE8|nr:luciferin 4-monooxygenase-like isoform X1 [Aricia agestis]XP_041972414.1 luciferin 4-monooxygenase-like isoform X1 [Aricia agestis]
MSVLSHAITWFIEEVAARVVAQTGIPTDRHHVGKMLLQNLKDAPDFVLQIDGATGETHTYKDGMERSIKCATALKNLGLKVNDVIAVMGPNCLDLPITLQAGTYLGVTVAGFDNRYSISEFSGLFQQCPPKVVFCPSANVNNVQKAIEGLNIKALIVTFDTSDDTQYLNYQQFLDKYSDNTPADKFTPNDFDPSEVNSIIASTSGTTGLPKITPVTHKQMMIAFPLIFAVFDTFPTPTELALCMSPIQWLSAHMFMVSSVLTRFPVVYTSQPITPHHMYELINKYKPTFTISSPTFLTTLLKPGQSERCDFSSLRTVFIGGSAVSAELIAVAKEAAPNARFYAPFGMTECAGMIFSGEDPTGKSCGREIGHLKYRLVDPESGKDITEPDVPGELWVKGPTVFKGYYNNPSANASALTPDGWLKTGDIFHRDADYRYHFVDRLKLLLKYRNHQISPVEIEKVIIKHPGVLDVAVTGITDAEEGDIPVACVIPQDGCHVTAQEIKDMVKEELSDIKQLRGGVVFLQEFPLTSSSKVDRTKLKVMVRTMDRQ